MTKIASFLVILLACGPVSAQQVDSTLSAYSERYPQEKIHLHFDRFAYNKGETIWFKAYLLAGFDPSTYSRNVYVDWFDAGGKLLKHSVSPVFEASAKGQFDIPAGYTGAFLHVRAYTQWMLNFDTAFLYNKDIPVVQAAGPAARAEQARSTLTFFPEGGNLVNGLVSKVAFKANNQWGIPVAVSGVVQGSDGNIVDSLTTEHDGMGSLFVKPVPGVTYTATWMDGSGKTFHTDLPAAAPSGASLQVQPHADQSMVIVRRTADAPAELKTLHLLVHISQHLVYEAKLALDDKTEVAVQVPTATLPTGVLQFTLFDAGWKPVAERVTFADNQLHLFAASVNVLTRSQEKRGRNEVEINVPDSVFSNMSVAVTDGDLPSGNEDIVSRLLLTDDIRGAVYHPSYYFEGNDPARARQLDLVLLTHGWRRFNWSDIALGKLPDTRYPRDTNYLEIKGRVVPDRVRDLAAGQSVMLILESKDSSRQRLLLPVSPDGSFVQKGVTFYDTLRVYYDFPGNKRLSGTKALEMESSLLPVPAGLSGVPGFFRDTMELFRTHFFADQEADRARRSGTIDLAAITIKGRTRRPVDVLDDKYATGFFKRDAGFQFDVKDDPLAQHSIDIFFYLKQVVPGLEVQYKNAYPILRWRQATPVLFVDEVGMRADQVADIPISDIAYVKVFHPPFLLGGAVNPRAGAIAIYTKTGEDVKPAPVKGLNYKLLEGYTEERQFYSPDYSVDPSGQSAFLPDVRPTLYWNPYVLTDGTTHSVKLEFYNNDISRKLKIVVEGMNADGKLTRVEKIIQ
jgi:hypothetical protein